LIYPYHCLKCDHDFEVIKRVADIDNAEPCEACSGETERQIGGGQHFYGESDWDTAQWCPTMGCEIKSNAHRRQIAKDRGLTEVGNEHPDKMDKHYEDQRSRAREEAWDRV